MEISAASLQKFTTWLLGRGRPVDTAKVYCGHLKQCAKDPKGLTHRLVRRDLSPNTRHTNMAALASWAKYARDSDLRDELAEIRLPPGKRVTPKLPLSIALWRQLALHLKTCELRNEPTRWALLIMVKRGLRCADVLRIRRREIERALETGVLAFEGKRGKRSEFSAAPIHHELEALLQHPGRWDQVADIVCPDGTMRSAKHRLYRTLRSQAESIKINGSYPHQMRRTYATNFLKELAGDPQAIIKLQKHMDWESMNTAAMYADAVDSKELDTTGERMTEKIFG